MNITPINNTNFQGHLNLAGVKTNNARWENVAKHFSKQSKNFPNAEIRVCEVKHEMALETYLNNKSSGKVDIAAAFFTKTMDRLFAEKSDKQIADILVRLLNLGDYAKKEYLEAINYASMIAKKNTNPEQAKKTFDTIFGESSTAIKNEVNNIAKSDKEMENWAIILK